MRIGHKNGRDRIKWMIEFLQNWLNIKNKNIFIKKGEVPVLLQASNQINDFLLLLAKSQYTFLYQYFTSEEGKTVHARERFAPMWYALMHYLREEHPLEFLRMPPELGETVQEIIEKVEEYRKAYALEAAKK